MHNKHDGELGKQALMVKRKSNGEVFLEHTEVSIFEMEDANEDISIYDKIQVDSEIERNFVKYALTFLYKF